MVLPSIYYELLRLLFNNVDADSLLLYLLHSSSSSHFSPFIPLLLCEVNAVARPRPTKPRLFLQFAYPHRGFKICPFIWAAQAGKWKGCQSLEPWESAWLKRQCQNWGEGNKRANTLHTATDSFLSPSNVEKQEENGLIKGGEAHDYTPMWFWGDSR